MWVIWYRSNTRERDDDEHVRAAFLRPEVARLCVSRESPCVVAAEILRLHGLSRRLVGADERLSRVLGHDHKKRRRIVDGLRHVQYLMRVIVEPNVRVEGRQVVVPRTTQAK